MFNKKEFAKIIREIKETYSSQEEFAKKSAIGRTYLSQYMNMKLDEPPKPKILEKLANASNGITTYYELMSICDYVRTGDLFSDEINPSLAQSYRDVFVEYGISIEDVNLIESLSKSDMSDRDKEIANILNKYSNKVLKKVFWTLDACRKNLSNEIETFLPIKRILNELNKTDELGNPVVSIDLLDTIKADYDWIANEEKIGTVDISVELAKTGEFFALKVKDDSMADAILDGDIVIIRKQDFADDGNIVAAIINGNEVTLKMFRKTDNGIKLMPLNRRINPETNEPFYEDLYFSKEEIEMKPVTIIGILKKQEREW